MVNLQVTRIHTDELGALAQLAEEIWRECYADLLSAEQIDYMLKMMYAPAHVLDEIENDAAQYYWLKVDGPDSPAGETSGDGFLAFGPGEERDEIFLHKVYLHQAQRGRGFGAAALKWLIERGSESSPQQFSKIRLRVNRANHQAIRAYRNAGFEVVDKICSDIGGGFVMDDYVMLKNFG